MEVSVGAVGFLSVCLLEVVVLVIIEEKEIVVGSGFCCVLFCTTAPFASDVPILATMLFNDARGLCDLICFSTVCLTVVFCLTIGGSVLVLVSCVTAEL